MECEHIDLGGLNNSLVFLFLRIAVFSSEQTKNPQIAAGLG